MNLLRLVLWVVAGGAILYVLERFLGTEPVFTPIDPGDQAGQVGSRGEGPSRDALVSSWRTTFTNPTEAERALREELAGLQPDSTSTDTTVILSNIVDIGDLCTIPGEMATTINNGQPVPAVCRRHSLQSYFSWQLA
jgi:hypothetical protein